MLLKSIIKYVLSSFSKMASVNLRSINCIFPKYCEISWFAKWKFKNWKIERGVHFRNIKKIERLAIFDPLIFKHYGNNKYSFLIMSWLAMLSWCHSCASEKSKSAKNSHASAAHYHYPPISSFAETQIPRHDDESARPPTVRPRGVSHLPDRRLHPLRRRRERPRADSYRAGDG